MYLNIVRIIFTQTTIPDFCEQNQRKISWDFVQSPVSKLFHFFAFTKGKFGTFGRRNERMEYKTISSAENLLESMEDILLWSKGQMEKFESNFKEVSINSIFEDLQKF